MSEFGFIMLPGYENLRMTILVVMQELPVRMLS